MSALPIYPAWAVPLILSQIHSYLAADDADDCMPVGLDLLVEPSALVRVPTETLMDPEVSEKELD